MAQTPEPQGFELIFAIVNHGLGSRTLHIAKQSGVSGGTICLGTGTVKNHLLEILALSDTRKEIVLMIADTEIGARALEQLNKEMKFSKPNHGIAYSIPVVEVYGSTHCNCHNPAEWGKVEHPMYQSIIIIVDKGKGEDVVDAAAEAGSNGATIINARGSGTHETSKLFSLEIEPEKEIVLIIAKEKQTCDIVSAIRKSFQIDEPGTGIIFVQDVSRAYGLYE